MKQLTLEDAQGLSADSIGTRHESSRFTRDSSLDPLFAMPIAGAADHSREAHRECFRVAAPPLWRAFLSALGVLGSASERMT
jgi:hypothetical protein